MELLQRPFSFNSLKPFTFVRLILLLLLCLIFQAMCSSPSLDSQAEALLAWKASLLDRPTVHASWASSKSPCKWTGISCDVDGTTIFGVAVAHGKLVGKLDALNFSALPSLTSLRLGHNFLHGAIPPSIGNLVNLVDLDLSGNLFSGPVPSSIGNMTMLENLYLENNNITGSIPSSIGSLGKLQVLHLYNNHISGQVPNEIGALVNLVDLNLQGNLLTGLVPISIGNLTALRLLNLESNNIADSIPYTIGNMLNLNQLVLAFNNLTGPMPSSFGNLSRLSILKLGGNRLSGILPAEIGNLTNIVAFQVGNNDFHGSLPPGLCKNQKLQTLIANNNNFEGPLPKSLRDCTSLVRVRIERNNLSGDISISFGVYPKLVFIDFSYNNLHGQLSANWGQSHNLTLLNASRNKISGGLPRELANSMSLYRLNLSYNQLSGAIPAELGRLSDLQYLDLSGNKLEGRIPAHLGGCSNLILLKLSYNELEGSIPREVGNLKNLEVLLDLSHNLLTGAIPNDIENLEMLENLDLSDNNLTGTIPPSFVKMQSLEQFDVSYNDLEGAIPDSIFFQNAPIDWFVGNKYLCGPIRGLPSCESNSFNNRNLRHKNVMLSIIAGGIILLLIGVVVVVWHMNTKAIESNDTISIIEKDMFAVHNFDGRTVYDYIIAKTENFDLKYCIGRGGYGDVFSVQLPAGKEIAVKKLVACQDPVLEKSFENEISVLINIRHRNIVRLYGFCSHSQSKLLIYEYVKNGSLAKALSSQQGSVQLDWPKRYDVVKGIADALSYLHHDCSPTIIHQDISSKNILLNEDFNALLSDFGTAGFLDQNSSTWSTPAGTYGYLAPELSYTMKANKKTDVYGFGVVTLEILLGRYPADVISSFSAFDCQSISLVDILDKRILPPTPPIEGKVMLLAEVGFACTHPDPQSRPSMQHVSYLLSSGHSQVSPELPDEVRMRQSSM